MQGVGGRWKEKGNAKVREGFVRNKGLILLTLLLIFKLVLMDRRDKKKVIII